MRMSKSVKVISNVILASVVVIALGFTIKFCYHKIYEEQFSNRGEMSSELDYFVESDYANRYYAYFEGSNLTVCEEETNTDIFKYKSSDKPNYKSDWSNVFLASEDYVIEHFYNGKSHLYSHLNQMVGDCLYRLNNDTMTFELVYEVKGNSRILYANDDYLVLYNGNENACQWIEYIDDVVKVQKSMDFDLTSLHEYECVYNEKDNTLRFTEYISTFFGIKERVIETFKIEDVWSSR